MLGQRKVSTAEEIFFRKISTSESDCEVMQIQKGEHCNKKLLSPSRKSDLRLKLPSGGGNSCTLDFGDNVVAAHLESSYSKQSNEREQCTDFEVTKRIGTDRNQLLMGLSGQGHRVQHRKGVLCSSPPNLLRATDDRRSLELKYHVLFRLKIGKQNDSRK